MTDVNKVIATGRLVRDPQRDQTPGGKEVVNFTLANNGDYRNKDAVNWMDVKVWSPSAIKYLMEYAKKGDYLYVECSFTITSAPDKTHPTVTKNYINFTANDVKLMRHAASNQDNPTSGYQSMNQGSDAFDDRSSSFQ